jgi:hypothetical protein
LLYAPERSRATRQKPGGASHQTDGRHGQEALRRLLVGLDVAFRYDALDALLLGLARLQREPAAAQQQRLQQHDQGPAARGQQLLVDREDSEQREARNEQCESDRQVDDGGVQGIG